MVTRRANSVNINIKKSSGGTLQSLSNVISTDLQNGDTLVYDSNTNKWISQPVAEIVAGALGNTVPIPSLLDGGAY